MPLALFPDWLAKLSRATPFGASLYIPIQILLGNVQGTTLLQSLLIQFFWIVALVILDHFILALGFRKLVIQGG